MQQYHDLLHRIMDTGIHRSDRTGTGTLSVFGHQMRFNLSKGFPLVTTKKVSFNNIKAELLWFLRGCENVDFLHKYNCHIWDEWARPDGTFGPIYGKQWRSWSAFREVSSFSAIAGKERIVGHDDDLGVTFVEREIDQIQQVIDTLRRDPYSRRLIVSAWNVGEVDSMALPPCHVLFQFYVANNRLSCQLYQRSADVFLGVPYNIASYALLTHIIAQLAGLEVGEFIWTGGDTHIYLNHLDPVNQQLTRSPYPLPRLQLADLKSIDSIEMDDIQLIDYEHHPALRGEISV